MKGINRVSSDALREAARRSGKRKYVFAKDIGVLESYFHRIIRDGASNGFIQRLACALGLSITGFLIMGEEPEEKKKILDALVDELSKEEKEELKKRL